MKNRYVSLFGIIFCAIEVVSVLFVEEIDLHYRYLGEGRWIAPSGYLSPYVGFGVAALTVGIVFVLVSVLGGVFRNNAHKAPI
jgi:hypothetical protein